MFGKYTVIVKGKNIRTYEFTDVEKFRAYIRRKARQGFYAIGIKRYGFDEVRIRLSDELFEFEQRGCGSQTCFHAVFGTPGYQEVCEYLSRSENETVMWYHGTCARRSM